MTVGVDWPCLDNLSRSFFVRTLGKRKRDKGYRGDFNLSIRQYFLSISISEKKDMAPTFEGSVHLVTPQTHLSTLIH